MPKNEVELQAIVDRTWSEACDAEFDRCDEEYRDMRAAVSAFDAIVCPSSFDSLQPPPRKLLGLKSEGAVEFAKRVRFALSCEKKAEALRAFEEATGVEIGEPWLARLDGNAIRKLRSMPDALEVGLKALDDVVERLEDTAARLRRQREELK